jgi:RNA polymerase sigma-70 factor (ECF subfamily)
VEDHLSSLVTSFASGDRACLDDLMPAVYAELRKLAGSYMSRERAGHTLQPTALLHEAYIRMVGQRSIDWQNRAQLMAIAARMMRRVLLDHAAGRQAAKRGGGLVRITLTDDFALAPSGSVDLIDLDRALEQLTEIDPQQASVVELRFFGGMSDEEIGGAIEASPATVRRRWASARLWLARRLAESRQD